jgi:putative ATP-grasp target RiPP
VDLPSQQEVRPFGLAHTTVVPAEDIADVSHLRYDPARQLNVDTATGQPVTESGHIVQMPPTSYDTRYDNQWFTDKD